MNILKATAEALEDSPPSNINISPLLKEDVKGNGNKIEGRDDGDENEKDQQRMVVDGMSNGNIREGKLDRGICINIY